MHTRLLATALVAACALAACATGDNGMKPDMSPQMSMSSAGSMSNDASMSMDNGMSMQNPIVGGAEMYPTKNIVENAMNSKDHTTLVAALKAAGLVGTLQGPGPFTVFAPTNAAFDALPPGTVDKLLQPSMKADLAKVLTYHVVAGNLDSRALAAQIQAGGGKAMLKTVQGESLTVSMMGDSVVVTDAKGNMAHVTTADVRQSNGVIHVVDAVLMP